MTGRIGQTLLAGVAYDDRFGADGLLTGIASRLVQRGLRPAGVVQANEAYDPLCPCDMRLTDLGSGVSIRISQRLGRHARGCRLDPDALARAVALADAGLAGADILILNKFGKAEASGGGFREVIARAMDAGIPVLAGVSRANHAAFLDFAGDLGVILPASERRILSWIEARDIRGAAVA